MPCDSRSLSSGFLPTRTALGVIALLVSAPVLFSGCASSEIIPRALSHLQRDQSSLATVRSQDGLPDGLPEAGPKSAASSQSVAAEYGQLQSRFGTNQSLGMQRPESGVRAPGHSFLQPRARLLRPIPLPDNAAIPMSNHSDADPADGGSSGQPAAKPVSGDAQEFFSRTPWPAENGSAWQSTAPGVPSWKRLDENFADLSSSANMDSSNASQPFGLATGSTERTVDSSRSVGATEPIAVPPGTAEDVSQPSVTETPSESKAELAPEQEPTMLDRFRGLYAPRLEDNTDRLRKQMRRWPDPFGLLKERDETTVQGSTVLPSPPAADETQTADALQTEEAAPVATENAVSPLSAAIAEMESELAAWPETPSGRPERPAEWRQRQSDLRLLYIVAGRSAESMRVIESLPEEEQEFWQSLMLSMNHYRELRNETARPEQLSETLDHLRMAARKLQSVSTLQVRHMMFCERIDGFGNVSAFPTADFNPGQRVLVYTDVENFRSELTPEGTYRSEFSATIEFMRQGDDEIVETIVLPQILDHCNVERTDYFQSFELTLPALAGKYLVRIQLVDKLSLRTAESQLEFTIRSQNSGL